MLWSGNGRIGVPFWHEMLEICPEIGAGDNRLIGVLRFFPVVKSSAPKLFDCGTFDEGETAEAFMMTSCSSESVGFGLGVWGGDTVPPSKVLDEKDVALHLALTDTFWWASLTRCRLTTNSQPLRPNFNCKSGELLGGVLVAELTSIFDAFWSKEAVDVTTDGFEVTWFRASPDSSNSLVSWSLWSGITKTSFPSSSSSSSSSSLSSVNSVLELCGRFSGVSLSWKAGFELQALLAIRITRGSWRFESDLTRSVWILFCDSSLFEIAAEEEHDRVGKEEAEDEVVVVETTEDALEVVVLAVDPISVLWPGNQPLTAVFGKVLAFKNGKDVVADTGTVLPIRLEAILLTIWLIEALFLACCLAKESNWAISPLVGELTEIGVWFDILSRFHVGADMERAARSGSGKHVLAGDLFSPGLTASVPFEVTENGDDACAGLLIEFDVWMSLCPFKRATFGVPADVVEAGQIVKDEVFEGAEIAIGVDVNWLAACEPGDNGLRTILMPRSVTHECKSSLPVITNEFGDLGDCLMDNKEAELVFGDRAEGDAERELFLVLTNMVVGVEIEVVEIWWFGVDELVMMMDEVGWAEIEPFVKGREDEEETGQVNIEDEEVEETEDGATIGGLFEIDLSAKLDGVEVIVMLLIVTTEVLGRQLSKMELMLNAIELCDCFGTEKDESSEWPEDELLLAIDGEKDAL